MLKSNVGVGPIERWSQLRRVGKAKRAHHLARGWMEWWARRKRAFAHPTKHGSPQRNIQPPQWVHRHAVADIDQHRRGLGLDDRGPRQDMPGLEVIQRIDRHVAPRAEEGLPLTAWRGGPGRRC